MTRRQLLENADAIEMAEWPLFFKIIDKQKRK
jgi:hypothetical protein